MTSQITTIDTSIAKRGIEEALWSAIGSSIFPGASDESKLLAFDYCKARGLDIMKKPCHIVPMSVKDAKSGRYEWRDVIMPGIAEARITAHRTGCYAGQDAPIFGPQVDATIGKTKHTVPEFCTVTVYRIIEGQRVGTSHTEYFEEACGTTKDGELNSMWTKRKRGQLAKCAEAGALRKAFPEEMGGIITAEEAETEATMRDATPPRKGLEMTEEIKPFTQSTPDETTAPAAAEPEAKPARQRKERLVRDGVFRGIEARQGNGKAFWWVSVTIGDKTPKFSTFSRTFAENLMEMEPGTALRVTVVASADGQSYGLEDYTVIEEEAQEVEIIEPLV